MKKYLNILILLPGFLNAQNAPAEKKSDSSQPSSYWSPEQIMKMKSISAAQVSPDGNKVVYAVRSALLNEEKSEYINQLFVANSDGSGTMPLTQDEKNNTNPKWSPDGKRIAFISNRDGRNNLYMMPLDNREAERLTEVKTTVADFDWSPNGKMIAYTMTDAPSDLEEKNKKGKDDWYFMDENYKQGRLYVIRLEKDGAGKRRTLQLTKENRHISSFDWSPDNQWIAFTHAESPRANHLVYSDIAKVDVETSELRNVLSGIGAERNPQFSPDGKWIAYESVEDPMVSKSNLTTSSIRMVPVAGGKSLSLASTFDESPNLIGWANDGRYIYMSEQYHTLSKIYKLGVDGKTLSEWPMSDAGYLSSITINSSGTHFGLVFETLTKPPDVYITLITSYRPVRISNVNPEISSFPIPKTELISWKSKDGLNLEGLLTYPLHYNNSKKYPLVLLIQGGPGAGVPQYFVAGSGSLSIFPVASLTERGYFVLKVNARGSTGYGRAFREAIRRDWGGVDYRDFMSGVDHVIGMGLIDTAKLGVMGRSYGGIMASWMIARTNRFKAAAIGSSVVDLGTNSLTSDFGVALHSHMKKHPWDEWKIYDELSPLRYVKNIRTPVLLHHCEGDIRVPIFQGMMFYNALKGNGVPVRFLVFPRQSHGITEPKMLLKGMEANLSWMDHYLLGNEMDFRDLQGVSRYPGE